MNNILEGVINFNKPQNMTSHDLVYIVRKKLKIKKVGHTGTLDPMATGVLPICIGRATKIAEYLTNDRKKYRCEITFGITTDTQDKWGNVINERSVDVKPLEIKLAIESFIGEIEQIPPMYSALKHKGKKLYELAREGIEVERKPRKRHIYSIDILDIKEKMALFDVECSKGTYIRTLCYDIGEKLGCGAHMSSLERIQSGVFSINDSIDVEEFKKLTLEEINKKIISVDKAVSYFKSIEINPKIRKPVLNGVKLDLLKSAKFEFDKKELSDLEKILVYDNEKFIGIAHYMATKEKLEMEKLFFLQNN